MHLKELKDQLDALKKKVDFLTHDSAQKVYISTLEGFDARLRAIEQRLTEAGA